MHKTFAVIRAFAALALVLAMVAGVFSPRGAFAQDATPAAEPTETPVVADEPEVVADASDEPVASDDSSSDSGIDNDAGTDTGTDAGTGDSADTFDQAEEGLELRARQQNVTPGDGQGIGNTIFVVTSGFEDLQAGASEPLSGATFQVIAADGNTVIDSVTTGDNGLVFLNIPLNVNFYVFDTSNNERSETLNYSRTDVENGRPVVTATRIVEADTVENPSGDPGAFFPVAQDQIELRARDEETNNNQAGQTIFETTNDPAGAGFGVNADALDDSNPAGGRTFQVITIPDGTIYDTVTTGDDGVILLDAPIGIPFVVQDTDTLDASDVFFYQDETDVQLGRLLLTATHYVAVGTGNNTGEGPTGDILPFPVAADQVELRARFEQRPGQAGNTIYVEAGNGGVEDAEFGNGESIPAAGVTFTVLSEDNLIVDQATSNEDGFVLLDVPVFRGSSADPEDDYTIINDYDNDGETFQTPNDNDVRDGRTLITATIFVSDLDDVAPVASGAPSDIAIPSETASASASASAPASSEPSMNPSPEGNIVVITGAFQESADRAGEYDYFYDLVGTDEENDIRLAGEGEQTFVVANEDGTTYSEGSTDENGMVTLDAPEDAPYFIYEVDDFNDPYGSDLIADGSSANFFVVEYVSDITASPSATASSSAAASADASGSDAPAASSSSAAAASGAGAAGTGGATALPNTGAGDSGTGSSMTWALFALLAVVGVAAAGFGLRRRNV